MILVTQALHHRDGEVAGGGHIGNGAAGKHPEQAAGHGGDLGRSSVRAPPDKEGDLHEALRAAGDQQDGAKNDEGRNEGCRDTRENAPYPLGPEVEIFHDVLEAKTGVTPVTGDVFPQHGVAYAGGSDQGQKYASGPAGRLDYQQDEHPSHDYLMELGLQSDALHEPVVVEEDIDTKYRRNEGQKDVECGRPPFRKLTLKRGNNQKAQNQTEPRVDGSLDEIGVLPKSRGVDLEKGERDANKADHPSPYRLSLRCWRKDLAFLFRLHSSSRVPRESGNFIVVCLVRRPRALRARGLGVQAISPQAGSNGRAP